MRKDKQYHKTGEKNRRGSAKVLHLLSGGGLGGLEVLCKNIADYSGVENEFVFLFSGGKISDQLERDGRKICRLYAEPGRIRRLIKLGKWVRKNEYDVIIAHHGLLQMFMYYIFLILVFPHKVYIKYLHSPFEKKYYYRNSRLYNYIMHSALKYIFKRSDYVVAVSEFVKQSFLAEFPGGRERTFVIYNGIECIEQKERPGKRETIKILYIGRLVEVKGVDLLIQAVALLDEKAKRKCEIVIVGAGPFESKLKLLSKQYDLEQNVFFEGETLHKEKYFQEADLFVYPSIWQEAFGISIVEAMAHGLICVASDSGGIPEIICDKENGFLFSRGDEKKLAVCLQAVMELDETEWKKIQGNAYKTAEKFQIDRTIRELEQLYDSKGRTEKNDNIKEEK